ncbi:transcriptional regulator GlxA family with amidase domain [Bradyrhizobium sp. USDA 4353]
MSPPDREFVVQVSPLLHQAILALFDATGGPERAALLVLASPASEQDLATLASAVGSSARPLSRLFAAKTRLSIKAWCQPAPIAAAIERLATDRHLSVKQLAADLGYASVPALSHALRQVTGRTPTELAGASE